MEQPGDRGEPWTDAAGLPIDEHTRAVAGDEDVRSSSARCREGLRESVAGIGGANIGAQRLEATAAFRWHALGDGVEIAERSRHVLLRLPRVSWVVAPRAALPDGRAIEVRR